MHMNRLAWGVVVVVGVVGCARQGASRSQPTAETKQPLRDLSAVPVGAGYDRALNVERPDCFARDPKTVTPVRLWEATGFTAFTSAEVAPKVQSAIVVGVKVESDVSLGGETALRVGTSGEEARFVTLARFTARREQAGTARAASAACASVPSSAPNQLEDFVTACGDSALTEKSFGGHVLLSWKRAPGRPAVDELMGSALGARTVGATFDLLANLNSLRSQGLGKEEVFLEMAGLPLTPALVTLPDGRPGFTVDSTVEYLTEVSRLNASSFAHVTDYTFTRFAVSQVDLCLAQTGRQSALPEDEWACVHGHLSELADARDGTGEVAHFEDKYVEAKLVSELVADGRVVFNTVPQSRCPGIDLDGDPLFETSGPCQAKSVDDFVKFFEACAVQSAAVLTDCRNDVLETVATCGAFEAKRCMAPELRLSSGVTVTCSEAGMAAAMADMVPWQVNPPYKAVVPLHFQPPETLLVDASMSGVDLSFPTSSHFCAITGIRGALHEADFDVTGTSAGTWQVFMNQPQAPADRRIQLEVTCTAWENFYFYNQGSHAPVASWGFGVPQGDNSLGTRSLLLHGPTALSGVWNYLDEPQTNIHITNPSAAGSPTVFVKDLFPGANPSLVMYTPFSIQANPPLSGAAAGGSLTSGDPGRLSPLRAGFVFPSRDTKDLANQLPNNAFCFLVGLNGRYFNTSDWTRVERSDGTAAVRSSTPLTKDRNPGIVVQCASYDQP